MKSIRFRLVALSVLIFGFTVAVLAGALYEGIRRTQMAAFDASLHNYAVDIANSIDLGILGNLIVRTDAVVEDKLFPFPLGQTIVQIRTLNGSLLLTSQNYRNRRLPKSQEAFEAALGQGVHFETHEILGSSHRVTNYLIQRPNIPPLILQVAVPLTAIENERRQLLPILWTLIPLAIAAAAMVGLITSTRALEPVYRIIDSARAIKPDQLSARVPVPEETELKELGLTLNDLLERLQKAFESQEQFIADASHQLKTPLAIIKGELDVFHQSQRTPEEAKQLMQSIAQETSQLSKMVDDLLLLARFDSGAFNPTFSTVRMDEVILETMSKLGKFANEKSVQLSFEIKSLEANQDSTFEVLGDFDLLKAALFNLIENAIKYSPLSGQVHVDLISREKEIVVEVADNGPGIAREDLPRLFDRFFRASRSQHKIPGVGLGLSIAYRIAKFHNADLRVQSEIGRGSVFSLQIKKI